MSPTSQRQYMMQIDDLRQQLAECQCERDTMKDLWGEMLERYGSYKEQLATVTKQRDELAEALEHIAKVNCDHAEGICTCEYREAGTNLRAAIEQMEKADPVAWMVTFRRNSPSIDRLFVSSKDRASVEVAPHLIESVAPVFAHPATAVPEGWQLVPKEPTLEMMAAGDPDLNISYMRAVWSAMLSAAPKPGESE